MNHPRTVSGETLEIRGLRKTYGKDVVANDDVSLDVRPGEVFGLLGYRYVWFRQKQAWRRARRVTPHLKQLISLTS